MPEDKKLRTVRDRFNSLKTHIALRESLLDAPGTTEFDLERITTQLRKRLGDFKHIEDFHDARAAFVAWAVRQAQLTAQLRSILPELDITEQIASLVLLRLPDYQGAEDCDTLKSWAVKTASVEAFQLSTLAALVTEHRPTVRAGIRDFLCGCVGLGLDSRVGPNDGDARSTYLMDDGPWSLTVDEIESDVWMDVARDLGRVLASKAPMAAQLNRRGYWRARTWKTNRLRERKERDDMFFIGSNGIEKFDTDVNGETKRSDAAQGFIDLHSLHNPLIISELPWTHADLERELRRAGPFRADGFDVMENLSVAA